MLFLNFSPPPLQDLESRVKKIMAEEAEEKDRRREARVQAKKEKEQQVKEKLAEQGLGDDIDVMAAMGFGGFGSTKQ